jgi:isoleucyl-tRNA synthetase
VLTFTADEAWTYATTGKEFADDSVHLQDWPVAPAEWTDAPLEAEFATLLKLRGRVTEALEPLRKAGTIGKSLDATVSFSGSEDDAEMVALAAHRDSLPEFFIVSRVALEPKSGAALEIQSSPARDSGSTRCPRCWRWVPKVNPTAHGEVCSRCADALNC